MEIYTHVNMDVKRQAANVVEDLFPQPEESEPTALNVVDITPRIIPGGRQFGIVGSLREKADRGSKSTREQAAEHSYQIRTRQPASKEIGDKDKPSTCGNIKQKEPLVQTHS